MNAAVARRLAAEFTGTGLLVAVVVGSGIAASRLTPDGALRLLVNSVVTALGLAVLIVVFIPAGGAHFNPVVTAADWLLGRRTPHHYGIGQAAAVIASQISGAIGGAALADAMFTQPILGPSRHHRGGAPVLLSEVVATAGLMLVIVALARTGRLQHVAWAVGAWIGAAYWFTASTSFANPAVTIGRTLTSTYAGIAPASAPAFIAAQIVGGALGTTLAVILYPARPGPERAGQPTELAGLSRKARPWPASPRCCSSAPTTPGDPRWPPRCSATGPPGGSASPRPDPSPRTSSTPRSSRPWPRSAWTSPASSPNR